MIGVEAFFDFRRTWGLNADYFSLLILGKKELIL